jgi:NAD(P)-dependent dehydrogenase (short-subunit alcohol dehydrogenase family)
MLERLRLDGPPRSVAIVTGGGRGLGREMALALTAAGAEVCIAARTIAQLEETAAFIEDHTGRRPLIVPTDVRSPEQCDALVEATVAHFGRLDIMVANAGGGDPGHASTRIADFTDEDWRHFLGVNLDSAFFCGRAAVRQFLAQNSGGVIVNLASGMGLRAAPTALGYSSAKGGVVALTRSLAAQVAGEDIRVNCIVPGFVTQSPPQDQETKERLAARGRFIPVGRLGEAWELGPLAVFLCSDASSYITGECFVIDGGGLAGGVAPLGHLAGATS